MSDNTQGKLINVDLQPMADVLNNVINKMSEAVGWLMIPRGARKDMETATTIYIEGIKNDPALPDLVKAQKISRARKDIKEYCNLLDILEHAAQYGEIYNGLQNEPIDEEWAMFFCDKAKNVCRDDVKVLWGKILSEEYKTPGAVPKQLVHILSLMSKEDAELFTRVCGFCVNRFENGEKVETNLLVFYDDTSGLVEKQKMNSVQLFSLESLGLISIKEDTVLCLDQDETYGEFEYHGTWIRIHQRENNKEIRLGDFTLTKPGQVLADIIYTEPLQGFGEYISIYYTRKGHKVDIF